MTETASTGTPAATNPLDVTVPLPNSATPPAAAETPKEAPPAPEAATDADKQEKPKKPASERISELYAQKKEAERRAQSAESEAYRLREQLRAPSRAAEDDFAAQDTERMVKAVKSERFEQTVQDMTDARQAASRAQADMFHAKIDAARERMPDIDTVLDGFGRLPLSDAACQIIAESDKAPEIAYFLSKNPDQAYRLSSMPLHLQGAELARIEARVSSASKKTSTAPPPVPIIGGTNSPAGRKDPADMSMEEYAAAYAGRGKR
jgi:hypothetical protein